jgi:hypothetical protein
MEFLFAWLASIEIVGLIVGAVTYMLVAAWQLGTFARLTTWHVARHR